MNILEEANKLVHGDRNDDYGHPLDNHTTTARLFAEYLARKYGVRVDLDAHDTCIFNILQKVSRAANATTRDNYVDIAGYAANMEMIDEEVKRRKHPVERVIDNIRQSRGTQRGVITDIRPEEPRQSPVQPIHIAPDKELPHTPPPRGFRTNRAGQ